MTDCTCKPSDYVDYQMNPFLVFDKTCPKHGFNKHELVDLKPIKTEKITIHQSSSTTLQNNFNHQTDALFSQLQEI